MFHASSRAYVKMKVDIATVVDYHNIRARVVICKM
jgi:hypothetical protein